MSNRVQIVVLGCSQCPFVGTESSMDECVHPWMEERAGHFAITTGGPPPAFCPLRENSVEIIYGGRE